MGSVRVPRVGTRGKHSRPLTRREIKTAICTHDRLAVAAPPQQQTTRGVWRTKLACPTCGAWAIRETSAAAIPAAAPASPVQAEVSAASAWEDCTVELRCQERGTRVYPLCRYDAIALGPAGRYVAARSPSFDNGIEQAERAAILDAVAGELRDDAWEPAPPSTDRMPRFRRRLDAAAGTAVLT